LIVVAQQASFHFSAEWLTGRLYAVQGAVGIVMVSICQTINLCSKSVVVILPSLSEYTEVQFKLKTKFSFLSYEYASQNVCNE
jgi:hypothetical protein